MSNLTVLILTQSMAGKELLAAVRGRVDSMHLDCHTLTYNPQATQEIIFPHLANRIKKINKGSGVLVLIDNYGAHRSLLQKLLAALPIKIVSGINEPMLEAVRECQGKSLQQAADHVEVAGKKGISQLAEANH